MFFYLPKMFVRKKKNKSGIISVQVIDKSTGKYRVKKTIGSSSDSKEVSLLVQKGKKWIDAYKGELSLDLDGLERQASAILDNISQVTVYGTELLLGKIFDEIGFNQITSPLFKPLVLSRIESPSSKLKTTDYWFKYYNRQVDVVSIYRYLDRLHDSEQEMIQKISFNHTQRILGNSIQMVFYDVTTIYFEAEKEDNLCKTGFSKDGKHQHPQIVLGLLVSRGGYPLAYDIFEGNKYEGETMLPIIDSFKEKYGFDQVTVVADAGLLSNKNVEQLKEKSYHYILGARIKNEKEHIKKQILDLKLESGQCASIKKGDDTTLVISYSQSRANKDQHNRDRGLRRLEKLIAGGKLTKSSLNNRGYNKYLKMEGDIKICIDDTRLSADKKWDGLKGYQTNTKLSPSETIENYQHLWRIEKAFRISKHDLKIRPIFHRLERRIASHICLSFVAYKIYKELERQLEEKKAGISAEKAIDIAKTIYKIRVNLNEKDYLEKVLLIKEEQRWLAEFFDLN
ncbi:MAG: IS1634 family transposase [Cyclobacteriaceae bacterium]